MSEKKKIATREGFGKEIVALGKSDPQQLLDAPVKMPVRRLDETAAARHMILTEDME